MKRLIPVLFALVAPAALAWPACDKAGLTLPVALQRDAPTYPAAVREIGIEGSVDVAMTILRDGNVGWVSVLHADPPGYFEQAAAIGVRGWRFEPASQDGVPVECRMVTRLRFTLVDTVDAAGRPLANKDRPDPVYPARMLAERVEGYAELEFQVAADGSVEQPQVITAMPRGEFELAALDAVRTWRFPAGSAAQHMTRRFDFRLPDTTLTDVPPITLASAPFPMLACEQQQTGQVSLEVDTDASGLVRKAHILSSTPKGLFDHTALLIARASRMTPAYRAGQPIAAIALLTLSFDPAKASCPGSLKPDPRRSPQSRPAPSVSGHDERPAGRGDLWVSLSPGAGQQVTLADRRQPAVVE